MRVSYLYPDALHKYETKVLVRQLVGSHPDRETSEKEGKYRRAVLHWNLPDEQAEAAAKRLKHLRCPDQPKRHIEVEV